MNLELNITEADVATGEATLAAMATGRRVFTKAELARAAFVLVAEAQAVETAAKQLETISRYRQPTTADMEEIRELLESTLPGEVGDRGSTPLPSDSPLVMAVTRQVRDMYHHVRTVNGYVDGQYPPPGSIPPGGVIDTDTAYHPVVWPAWAGVVSLIGSVALIAGAWWGVRSVEEAAQVEVAKAAELAQTRKFLGFYQAKVAAGEPLGDLPPELAAPATAQKNWLWYALGGAALLGAGAVAGYVGTMPNPLSNGYSRSTISKNIQELQRSGKTPSQASAIAYRRARADYRRQHGERATLPSHLQPMKSTKSKATKRPAKAKSTSRPRGKPSATSKSSRPAPKSKRSGKQTTKRSKTTTKKVTPARTHAKRVSTKRVSGSVAKRKNPSWQSKVNCRRKPGKAKFIRAQQRKGRTKRQAESAWNLVWGCKRARKPRKRKRK